MAGRALSREHGHWRKELHVVCSCGDTLAIFEIGQRGQLITLPDRTGLIGHEEWQSWLQSVATLSYETDDNDRGY